MSYFFCVPMIYRTKHITNKSLNIPPNVIKKNPKMFTCMISIVHLLTKKSIKRQLSSALHFKCSRGTEFCPTRLRQEWIHQIVVICYQTLHVHDLIHNGGILYVVSAGISVDCQCLKIVAQDADRKNLKRSALMHLLEPQSMDNNAIPWLTVICVECIVQQN